MKQYELGKRHKLCGAMAVDSIFTDTNAHCALSYPLRAVWHEAKTRKEGGAPYQFVIVVPKKRLRHAVDRVTARRRIREAYRLNHGAAEPIGDTAQPQDIAFVYVANSIAPSAAIHSAMQRLLRKIHNIVPKTSDNLL